MGGVAGLGGFRQDIRYALRLLRLNAGFATIAVLSLALGIGANTAIFQLLDAVRLRTLPVKNPSELAIVKIKDRHWGSGHFHGEYTDLTNAIWEQIRDRQEGFSSILAWAQTPFNLAAGGEARYAQGMYVSGDFFRTLEVEPLLGRVLTAADDRRGCGAPGAVISYAFWQREFGGQASAIGGKLTLEGHPFPIIGVTPPGFFGVEIGRSYDVAVPICSEPVIRGEDSMLDMKHGWWLASMGRLKPGWTRERASAQLNAISTAVLEATVPPAYDAERAKKYMAYRFAAFPADNGFSSLRQEYENPLWTLLAIAGLVLLIACANLANLMLARASARTREIGVRLALGASRLRLLRQMLVESLVLSAIGAALGVGLAQALSRLLLAFLSTTDSPLAMNLGPDWRVLAFTAGLAVLTCLLFGMAPGLRSARVAPVTVLKTAGRGMTSGRERFGLRRVLVVTQVALSLVLLVGALLFVRTLRNLLTIDPGFRSEGVIVASIDLTRLNIAKGERQEFKRELLEKVRAVPGVESAADTRGVPLSGNFSNDEVLPDGDDKRKGISDFNWVSPGYFRTMKTPLLMGREFDEHDTTTAPKVAIVNEMFAKKFLNGEAALGHTFVILGYVGQARPTYQIIGLVKNTKYSELREDIQPIAYLAAAQDDRPDNFSQFLIRSRLSAGSVLPAIKETLLASGPEMILDFRTLDAQIRDSLMRERLMATLSGFFGVLAVVLATVGLYGVISYTVARRTNEIGVRVALGAQRGHVIGMILREAGWLLGIGAAAGVGISLFAAKAAASFLYGLKPHDPLTLAAAVAGLGIVAAAASFLPARRAAGLDPVAALREE
ncbi:MAG TPA: ABC transporter permease [Candidatus Acidoferrales bacterium]|nr:ABC transporter permease [Candidatus Acidoferrales bacterium]